MPDVCPTCDAIVSGSACVICGWKPPRISAAPPVPKLAGDPRARLQAAEVHALVDSVTRRLSLKPDEEPGDCPTCWRNGTIKRSRTNEREFYGVCNSCGTRTVAMFPTELDALAAWRDGKVKLPDLPWPMPAATDPRVQAHAQLLEGQRGLSPLGALRKAQDLVGEAAHRETCPVCQRASGGAGRR